MVRHLVSIGGLLLGGMVGWSMPWIFCLFGDPGDSPRMEALVILWFFTVPVWGMAGFHFGTFLATRLFPPPKTDEAHTSTWDEIVERAEASGALQRWEDQQSKSIQPPTKQEGR